MHQLAPHDQVLHSPLGPLLLLLLVLRREWERRGGGGGGGGGGGRGGEGGERGGEGPPFEHLYLSSCPLRLSCIPLVLPRLLSELMVEGSNSLLYDIH